MLRRLEQIGAILLAFGILAVGAIVAVQKIQDQADQIAELRRGAQETCQQREEGRVAVRNIIALVAATLPRSTQLDILAEANRGLPAITCPSGPGAAPQP